MEPGNDRRPSDLQTAGRLLMSSRGGSGDQEALHRTLSMPSFPSTGRRHEFALRERLDDLQVCSFPKDVQLDTEFEDRLRCLESLFKKGTAPFLYTSPPSTGGRATGRLSTSRGSLVSRCSTGRLINTPLATPALGR
ncbi:unnamed protein product [Cladocopium goreaui]|uniref:Uncharacterized protein n=1 Tax=Cladocopium goreaui TaxID=2562237 RepID=A0A9P1BVY5_9DINO|nr:unnamed protein product [Cladocopium goreaui]|mmetsp:Transcript_66948/g.146728  ORF Transcript_66948/g.146728 Transcript_66948/m.146728 type:complete len:137 (+) Transcript_66948:39-449(+)